jgi:predicted Zn-dependent peptidase
MSVPFEFHKTKLNQGLRVLFERHPGTRGLSIGIWVPSGTRHEPQGQTGIAHFIEHLVFKGTNHRTAFEIAKSLEEVGGELNAYTTREYTVFHAYVLKQDWERALDVLSDLVLNMKISQKDFKLEKSVVQQEIAMSEDNLEDLIYDLYLDQAYRQNPLGRPILGYAETIEALTMKDVQTFYRQHYQPSRMILSLAGDVDLDPILKACQKKFPATKLKTSLPGNLKVEKPKHQPIRLCIDRPSEHIYLLAGIPTVSFRHKFRFEAFVVNALLGGGMTSRLYQKVREQMGLVYSIHSSLNTFVDEGIIFIQASCEPKSLPKVLKLVQQEILEIQKKGISKKELAFYKRQIIGSLVLGGEDVENRMTSLASNEMVFEKYMPVEEVIRQIENITVESLRQYLDQHLNLSESGLFLMGSKAGSFSKQVQSFLKLK